LEHPEPAPVLFLRDEARNRAATPFLKRMVESGAKPTYSKRTMNAQLANWYRWYRFTWNPSGWRGAFL